MYGPRQYGLQVGLHGWGISSFLLREENRLRVFENRVLRGIFGPKMKWKETGEDYIMRSFITCTLHKMLLG
jgi:hypothetical protein